jgi:transcriptional regulator with XRE-family HTH domain
MDFKIARKIARLTQQELAEQAGVTNSFISKIETGEHDIRLVSYVTVVRLAKALNIEPDELLMLSIPPTPQPIETPTPKR